MKPIILVTGLGRCGSSLTMQMLAAAGIPTVGEAPGYEVDELNHVAVDRDWLAARPGHAIKWLDPHLTPIPRDIEAVVIWLQRDIREQARSQAKFATTLMGRPMVDRAQLKRWAAGLKADLPAAFAAFAHWPHMTLDFETTILSPLYSARSLALWLAPWFGELSPEAMAAAVLPRLPACRPDLSIEVQLMERNP